MKKISIIALALPVFAAACTSECIEDSGKNIHIESVVKNFDQIKVEGAIKLVLKQDSTYSIRIEADSNIMKHITADVSGKELKVKLDDSKYCGSDSIVVYAGIGELKKINADGAVKIVGDGRIYGNDVDFKFAGTSDVNLDLSVAKLVTKIDGNGLLTLRGQSGVHDLDTKGTAKVNAFDFVSGVYDIDVDGIGKANINVLNELKVRTSGSSEIYYKGNPKKVDEKKSGATKLEKVN
ncbi:head GIN domain-containing protein [Pedobacter frigoris]|uniref:head GIN domain-containing protein n=1 Tax=Pedobacter frigoris TaxID=2571272 RepID=UPI00293130EE|nr:head GIN domain-containing protein [Pedobacter frigoris]